MSTPKKADHGAVSNLVTGEKRPRKATQGWGAGAVPSSPSPRCTRNPIAEQSDENDSIKRCALSHCHGLALIPTLLLSDPRVLWLDRRRTKLHAGARTVNLRRMFFFCPRANGPSH